jgi:hypothetical protein
MTAEEPTRTATGVFESRARRGAVLGVILALLILFGGVIALRVIASPSGSADVDLGVGECGHSRDYEARVTYGADTPLQAVEQIAPATGLTLRQVSSVEYAAEQFVNGKRVAAYRIVRQPNGKWFVNERIDITSCALVPQRAPQ